MKKELAVLKKENEVWKFVKDNGQNIVIGYRVDDDGTEYVTWSEIVDRMWGNSIYREKKTNGFERVI